VQKSRTGFFFSGGQFVFSGGVGIWYLGIGHWGQPTAGLKVDLFISSPNFIGGYLRFIPLGCFRFDLGRNEPGALAGNKGNSVAGPFCPDFCI
jgi:hypothetical protein